MLEVEKLGGSIIHDRFMKEAGITRLDPGDLSDDILSNIKGISFQFAGEHCTECAAPDCHDSCDLFERGPTGRCRRFLTGLISRSCGKFPFGYSLEKL